MTRQIQFEILGLPPAKNEALSMLGRTHSHASRVMALLQAAQEAIQTQVFHPFENSASLGLEVVLYSPWGVDPWDATNYLGGISDVLEDKSRRGNLVHLGELARVFIYQNDRQIRQANFRHEEGQPTRYHVNIWNLKDRAQK